MSIANQIKKFFKYIREAFYEIDKEYPLILDDMIFSKKYMHDVCVLRVVGTETYLKVTPSEIISQPKFYNSIPPAHLLAIKELNDRVNQDKMKNSIIEEDCSGNFYLKSGDILHIDNADKNHPLLENLERRDIYRIAWEKGEGSSRRNNKEMHQLLKERTERNRNVITVLPFKKNHKDA